MRTPMMMVVVSHWFEVSVCGYLSGECVCVLCCAHHHYHHHLNWKKWREFRREWWQTAPSRPTMEGKDTLHCCYCSDDGNFGDGKHKHRLTLHTTHIQTDGQPTDWKAIWPSIEFVSLSPSLSLTVCMLSFDQTNYRSEAFAAVEGFCWQAAVSNRKQAKTDHRTGLSLSLFLLSTLPPQPTCLTLFFFCFSLVYFPSADWLRQRTEQLNPLSDLSSLLILRYRVSEAKHALSLSTRLVIGNHFWHS